MTKTKDSGDASENDGATRVDLGDDLLEKTAMLPGLGASSSSSPPIIPSAEDPESQFQSARILMNEGLLEQAKSILHRVLIADPSHVPARLALDQLHELELKQIFSEERARKRYGAPDKAEPDALDIDVDVVLSRLEDDLALGMTEADRPSLLQDSEALLGFTRELDRTLAEATPRDRIDIGIGFLEMGLYDLAARQFTIARGLFAAKAEASVDLVSAASLLSYALMLAGHPFEAAVEIQPLLNDSDIPQEHKVELLYLMGRIHEKLGKHEEARDWFERVRALDPFHRDVQRRLK